ncbi:MAG: hypothetical protein AAGU73_00355 [Actinomycetota bacterium]
MRGRLTEGPASEADRLGEEDPATASFGLAVPTRVVIDPARRSRHQPWA